MEYFKVALLKKKNRRISVLAIKGNDGTYVRLITKRLAGPWNERQILETDTIFGIESFMVIKEVFDMLCNDLEFKKAINPELGVFKNDKFSINTNIKP